jgi:hypothetical protein
MTYKDDFMFEQLTHHHRNRYCDMKEATKIGFWQ